MSDWEENGRKIRDRYRTAYAAGADALASVIEAKLAEPLSEEAEYINALRSYAHGDQSKLVEWLAAEKPTELKWLAQVMNDEAWKPKNGRPKNRALRAAATVALRMYREWQRENKAAGLNDWGLSRHMKDEACGWAIELELGADLAGDESTAKAVIDLMERPKDRRN